MYRAIDVQLKTLKKKKKHATSLLVSLLTVELCLKVCHWALCPLPPHMFTVLLLKPRNACVAMAMDQLTLGKGHGRKIFRLDERG